MGALEVNRLGYRAPGGRLLFDDVSFRVGNGEHAALVGKNGVGKTTLIRVLAGEEDATSGSFAIDGRLGVMHQFVGSIHDDTTVSELLLGVGAPEVRAAHERLVSAERSAADGSPEEGMRLASAWSHWGDVGGHAAEVLWDECTVAALHCAVADIGSRPVASLSGGEQKRLVLEVLFRGGNDVLVLDEPDNYLDVVGKRWLEQRLRGTDKTVLFVSHDRELLERSGAKVVTLEGRGAWTHGGTFATWHDAREDRLARTDEEHRRWREERRHLQEQIKELRRRSQMTDAFASRLRATHTKLRRHEDAAPRERPKDQQVSILLSGGRTGKRVLTVEGLAFPGIVEPFTTDVVYGERVGVLGPNGSGKSHFLKLLAGEAIEHRGVVTLGARVVPGYFSQTHDRADLAGRTTLDVLLDAGVARNSAMAILQRYELGQAAGQRFATLSGGQQARLQVLLLELSGATLLLLDEPTDNLDVESAEALEIALARFEGTVLAVTHDRWFMRSFGRFLVFRRDGSVIEALEPVWE